MTQNNTPELNSGPHSGTLKTGHSLRKKANTLLALKAHKRSTNKTGKINTHLGTHTQDHSELTQEPNKYIYTGTGIQIHIKDNTTLKHIHKTTWKQ